VRLLSVFCPGVFWSILSSTLLLCSSALCSPPGSVASERARYATEVEVQWQAEAEAEKYHIEVKTKSGKFVKRFESKRALFKFKAEPGRYMIRAQTKTIEGRLGLWSEWVDVDIPPKSIEFKANLKTEIVAQPETLGAQVHVMWEGSGFESKFEIRVSTEGGQEVKVVETLEPDAKIDLPPGKYFVEVVAIAQDGLRSKPAKLNTPMTVSAAARLSPPLFKAALPSAEELAGGQRGTGHRRLEFESQPGRLNIFRLERCPHLSESWTVVEKGQLEGKIWSPRGDLSPGKYRVIFWSEAAGWEKSPA
jgi:hypothetical protein